MPLRAIKTHKSGKGGFLSRPPHNTQRAGPHWALPVIGNPITILAGILRVNFAFLAAVAFPLRFLRYLLIVGIF